MHVGIVYNAPLGNGGLGYQAATVVQALQTENVRLSLWGPSGGMGFESVGKGQIEQHEATLPLPAWLARYSPWRWYQGHWEWLRFSHWGQQAAQQLAHSEVDALYTFTEVGLEPLRWAAKHNFPACLDSPTGHVRNFRHILQQETRRWCNVPFLGHPTEAMCRRAEEEYRLAGLIRTSSAWAKQSLIAGGVAADKIVVVPMPINLHRFQPAVQRLPPEGPLRICFVGSVDCRKGFVYLLRALQQFTPQQTTLRMVGGTVNRACRKLLQREAAGLNVVCEPGDPLPVYQQSELFVLPSLEDGFGLVVAEAMACGLPVIVTDQCGAAAWVTPGETGWVIPSANTPALAEALALALQMRQQLPLMGTHARQQVEALADSQCLEQLRTRFYSFVQASHG